MESTNIYKESYESLKKLKKSLSQDVVTIDFTKFDNVTAGKLRQAIVEVTSTRIADTNNVIMNSNSL